MSGVKLYEIADQIRAVGNALVENGGELTLEIEAELKAWQGALDFKAANAGLLVLELERQAEMATTEAQRLKELAYIRQGAAERLRQYIQVAMEAAGIQKVETDYCRLTIAKNPPKVEPFGEANPGSGAYPEFIREIPARYEWDKKKLLEAWKANPVSIDGIATVTQGTSLRIK